MSVTTERTRDGTAAKAGILAAAERLFAEKGFAATSVRDVAEASGTSKALIHHHFGSKEDLYLAVKRAVIARHAEAQAPQLEAGTDPVRFVADGMRTLFELYRRNPALVRLGTWAQLDGTSPQWPGDEELLGAIIDRMRAAQGAGVVRGDIDAAFLVTMAIALVEHWWQFRGWRQHLYRHFPEQEEAELDRDYLEAAIRVFLDGVLQAGGSGVPLPEHPAAREGTS